MGATSLAYRWEPSVLTENVLNTISHARTLSTRRLYALKWSVFSAWCVTHSADPEVCDISLIFSFLQKLLEKGCSPSMLKVYAASIAASHAPIDDQSVGSNNLVVRFLKGSRRLRSCHRPNMGPAYSVDGSQKPSFWAATVCWSSSPDIKHRSATGTSMGKTYGRSAGTSYLEFGPNDSKIVLKPRHGYISKVLSTPFRAPVITLSALPLSALPL